MLSFQAAIVETETLLSKYKTSHQSVFGFNPEGIPGRRRFLSRRVKLLKNLLRWRKYTGERFGLGLLIGRLVEGCILGVAESGWDVGGEEILRLVSSLIT
jgi:GC-rich sequence DNA-binding factor